MEDEKIDKLVEQRTTNEGYPVIDKQWAFMIKICKQENACTTNYYQSIEWPCHNYWT